MVDVLTGGRMSLISRSLRKLKNNTPLQDELEFKYFLRIGELILTLGPNPHYYLYYVMLTYHLQNGGLSGKIWTQTFEFHRASELKSKWLEAAWQKSLSNKAFLFWDNSWSGMTDWEMTSPQRLAVALDPLPWHLFQEAPWEWRFEWANISKVDWIIQSLALSMTMAVGGTVFITND